MLEPDVYTNNDCVKRLEKLLQNAKEGKLTDYMMVYLEEREYGFSHSYRGHKKSMLLGLMFVLMQKLAHYGYELESQDE